MLLWTVAVEFHEESRHRSHLRHVHEDTSLRKVYVNRRGDQ